MVDKQNLLSHIPAVRQVKLFNKVESRASLLTFNEKRVFDKILKYFDYYGTHQVSQIRIAQELGISRQTVNTAIGRLAKFKFIGKITRYKKTCIYSLSKFFQNHENRRRLLHIFKEARSFLNPILLRSRYIANYRRNKPENRLTLTSYYNYKVTSSYSSLFNNINTNIKSYTYNEASRAHAHVRNDANAKKGAEVEEVQSTMSAIITPNIREITKQLHLSKWGQIKLLVFPDGVVEHGLQLLKKAPNVPDKFPWLFARLRDYCVANKIDIEWNKFYFLANSLHMPEGAPLTLAPSKQQKDHKKNSISTVPDSVRFARPDIRRAAPEEDKFEAVKIWESWRLTDECRKAAPITGTIHPVIVRWILDGDFTDDYLNDLYIRQPDLKVHVDRIRNQGGSLYENGSLLSS